MCDVFVCLCVCVYVFLVCVCVCLCMLCVRVCGFTYLFHENAGILTEIKTEQVVVAVTFHN